MAIPEATLTIKDGALGIVPPNVNGIQAVLGVCTSGTVNTVYSFNDIQALKDGMGTGPLVEQAGHVLSIAGGPVVVMRVTGGTAGAFGSVTPAGTNTGLSVLTLTASVPYDSYQVIVKIVTGGTNPAAGVAVFKVSLDNGRTYGPDTALPTSGVYTVPSTGIILTFSAATLVALDTYTFSTTAPAYDVTALGTAVDALLADSTEWFMLNLVGVPADTTAAAAVFAALDSKLTTAQSSFRYVMGLMSSFDDTDANIKTCFLNLTSTRVAVAAGFENITSPVSGAQIKRSCSFTMAARASAVPPSEDLGRVASGNALGVVALVRDEFRTPGMDVARFCTMRTHIGLPGFYITNGRLLSSNLSDFQYIQHRRVMDVACRTVRAGQLHYLNDSVRVNKTTGLILDSDANAIDSYLTGLLRITVTQPGFASDASAQVDRTVNILSTNTLVVGYRVIPLGYLKTITGTIGFFNPTLAPV